MFILNDMWVCVDGFLKINVIICLVSGWLLFGVFFGWLLWVFLIVWFVLIIDWRFCGVVV